MAVNVYSTKPQALLDAIGAKIADGGIESWSVDSDGDFTQLPEQWAFRAWLRPKVLEDRVVFYILAPQETQLSTATYAVYHGRFIEFLLRYFDGDFSRASATSMPVNGDKVRG